VAGRARRPVQAIRHAQAVENWGLAARLLADNWRSLYFDGRMATIRELLSRVPIDRIAADPELAALAAADRRMAGSLGEADRYLALAERMSGSVPEERRWHLQATLALARMALARARNDLDRSPNRRSDCSLSSTVQARSTWGLARRACGPRR
jgi:LuxR family transcriptional regulator, maltose regulon positive regulatory protein